MQPNTCQHSSPGTPALLPITLAPSVNRRLLCRLHVLPSTVALLLHLLTANMLFSTVLFVDVGNNRAVLDNLPNSFVSNTL